MKTAMQELIERYYLFENGEYKPDAFKKHFAEFYPLHLLKEKNQIKDARDSIADEMAKTTEDLIVLGKSKFQNITSEQYYNQTYNQKQHIIDIMKADEDDGLYKMFDTDSDKKH
jgi:hypothetical protein